jgi:hypothetical protein
MQRPLMLSRASIVGTISATLTIQQGYVAAAESDGMQAVNPLPPGKPTNANGVV